MVVLGSFIKVALCHHQRIQSASVRFMVGADGRCVDVYSKGGARALSGFALALSIINVTLVFLKFRNGVENTLLVYLRIQNP